MALKLDDLLIKKKEPVQILDLSKTVAESKEELKKLMEKVTELKIKLEKIKPEDIKIQDKKFSFTTSKKELKRKTFPFANPVPSEMKQLHLKDLCSIGIQWKMLTSLRPKSKLDEEYFSKLIELGKLQQTTKERNKCNVLKTFFKKSKNRAGVIESKIVSCRQCNEEFCSSETCGLFSYESFERVNATSAVDQFENEIGSKKKRKKRKKRKVKRKLTKKAKSHQKTKNRPIVLGSKINKYRGNFLLRNRIKVFDEKRRKLFLAMSGNGKMKKKNTKFVKGSKQKIYKKH